jgi:sugar lactone lactonase YvrE
VGESSSIQCYHSQTGELLHTISLPIHRPTSCVFGGNDLRDLYVTSRVEKVEEGGSEHWGAIVRVRIDGIQGMGTDAGLFNIEEGFLDYC